MPDKTRTSVRRRRIAGEGARDRASSTPARAPKRDRPVKRPASTASTWRPGRRTYAWFVPLCVVALAAAVVAGWSAYRDYRGGQVEDARSDAVAPAGQAAEALLSYRHDTLDSELDSERDLMTDSYAEEFLNIWPEKAQQLTSEEQATVESTVLAAAPIECGDDCSPDRVDVLVYLNTESTVAGGQPDVKANRAVLSMEREDGTWRVGGIDLLRPT